MSALSPTVRGMLWMAATGVLFTLLNSTMKKLSHELDPWLVGFLRYLLGALVMLAPALRLACARSGPRRHGCRSCAACSMPAECCSGSRHCQWCRLRS